MGRASPFACAQQLDFKLRPHGRSFATGTSRQTLALLNLQPDIMSSSARTFARRGALTATGTRSYRPILLNSRPQMAEFSIYRARLPWQRWPFLHAQHQLIFC